MGMVWKADGKGIQLLGALGEIPNKTDCSVASHLAGTKKSKNMSAILMNRFRGNQKQSYSYTYLILGHVYIHIYLYCVENIVAALKKTAFRSGSICHFRSMGMHLTLVFGHADICLRILKYFKRDQQVSNDSTDFSCCCMPQDLRI